MKAQKGRIQIDPAQVEQFAQACDNEEQIALALGVSYSTFRRRKAEDEQIEQALKRGRAKADIFVGGKLMELIKKGNVAATIFYMKSRCGWRESGNLEITGAQPVQITVVNDLKD